MQVIVQCKLWFGHVTSKSLPWYNGDCLYILVHVSSTAEVFELNLRCKYCLESRTYELIPSFGRGWRCGSAVAGGSQSATRPRLRGMRAYLRCPLPSFSVVIFDSTMIGLCKSYYPSLDVVGRSHSDLKSKTMQMFRPPVVSTLRTAPNSGNGAS